MSSSKDKQSMMTVWGRPSDMVASMYGHVNYQDWCMREMDRVNKAGRTTVALDTNKDGRIGLRRVG